MSDINFSVDTETCIACGMCVEDCPVSIIEMQDDTPVITNEENCLKCQHCLTVCPTGSISILGRDPEDSVLLKDNLPEFSHIQALIKGRRSVRRYRQKNIDRADIVKLLETVYHAPTAHNSQTIHFTVVDDILKMQRLAGECVDRLGELAARDGLPDTPLKPFLEMGLHVWKEYDVDIFFRKAPHMVIVSAPLAGPAPQADSLISLSYFELAAQSMGLGTLWNGIAKSVIFDIFPDIGEKLGVPADHLVGYVMIFGEPAVRYARTAQREPANIHFSDI